MVVTELCVVPKSTDVNEWNLLTCVQVTFQRRYRTNFKHLLRLSCNYMFENMQDLYLFLHFSSYTKLLFFLNPVKCQSISIVSTKNDLISLVSTCSGELQQFWMKTQQRRRAFLLSQRKFASFKTISFVYNIQNVGHNVTKLNSFILSTILDVSTLAISFQQTIIKK